MGLGASAVGGLLAACGGEPTPTASPPSPLDTALPKELLLYTWSDYITPGIKRGFEERYGVEVVERYADDSETLYIPIEAGAAYDVVVASDYLIGSWRRAKPGLLRPLDLRYLPNLKNVIPLFAAPSYDDPADNAGQRYSVPYQWEATGIAVRTDKIGEPISRWSQLWDRSFRKQIDMLDDERETIGVALLKDGHSVNTTNQADLDQATAELIAQKPLVRSYEWNMHRAIISGVPLVHCGTNDCVKSLRTLGPEKVSFALPEEGFCVWADTMCIPSAAPSPYAAHLFIDYLCEPEVNAELTNYTEYLSPVSASLPLLDPQIASVTPTDEQLSRAQFILDLGEFGHAYAKAWNKVQSAG